MNPNPSSFYGLGIAPGILSVLDKLGLVTPTPIQEQAIPRALEGKDIMGIAQTGTGKTFAFGIPLIQHLLKNPTHRALVILPTRELAEQVNEALHKVGTPLGLKTVVLIGGESMGRQIAALSRKPQIIIATPGRLIDHLEQKLVTLKDAKVVVLDEADRMLDMGFAPQLKRILSVLPTERQTLLFSATMPENIVAMARAYLKLPLRVEIARPGTAANNVTQELFFVSQPDKPRLLEKILQEYRGSVLVFLRTKFTAKRIAAHLRALGHTAVELHSNRSQSQRREALDGFKKGKYRVVVATDIAARGIDVRNIELVVNYDLPAMPDDYVHRIGRTGRAGESGHAISFAQPSQRRDVQDIERLMRTTLQVSRLPELPPPMPMAKPSFSPYPSSSGHSSSRGGNGSGSRGRAPFSRAPRPGGGNPRHQQRSRFGDRRGPRTGR